MYRVSRMSHVWYAVEFNSFKNEVESIQALAEDGDMVLIIPDLSEVYEIADMLDEKVVIVE